MDLSRFVDKYYEMDPKTDDLIPSGGRLAPGMRVLFENPNKRVLLEHIDHDGATMEKALRWNRWATIVEVQIFDKAVTVAVVYDDGTKKLLLANVRDGWYVKIDNTTEETINVEWSQGEWAGR